MVAATWKSNEEREDRARETPENKTCEEFGVRAQGEGKKNPF
jgi:hypothetical protein